MSSDVAFLEVGAAGGHRMIVGGLTALERAVREQAKRGARAVLVASEPVEMRREVPVPVEFVAPGTAAPAGATVARADVVAGVEIVDEPSRRRAEWALIRGMNKSFEGPVDALINWRFSMRITRALSGVRALTPNHITIVSISVGLAAAALALQGTWALVALAGVLLELNSILDSCDGELARLRFQYSKLGQWLDNLGDDIVDNAFIACASLGIGGPWAWIGCAAAAGRVLVSLAQYVVVFRRTGTGDVFAFRWWFEREKQTADEVYDPRSPVTWIRSLGRRDTYVFVWMIVCLAGFPHWIVGHAAAIAAVNLTLLVLHLTVYRPARA